MGRASDSIETGPLPLQYLIDSDDSLWGSRQNGMDIRPPKQLGNEDPNQILIIIYSSFAAEIEKQVTSIGPYTAICAPEFFCPEGRYHIKYLQERTQSPPRERSPSSENGILVQGPVYPGITKLILKYYAHTFPRDHIILSTWSDTQRALIEEVIPYVDHCVESEPPSHGGVQNRNYQIVSTQKGIVKARELGVSQILKTRTDIVIMESKVFSNASNLRKIYADTGREESDDHRLIVPQTYTRKFLPYSPSDLIICGSVNA